MFEMILMNVQDDLFYQQYDFTQQVQAELKKSSEPYAVHIGLPQKFYLDSGRALPIFVSVKENTRDNDVLKTETNGRLIFSNILTADLFLYETFQELKQRPYDADDQPAAPPGAPLGWRPPKTTYYRSEYRQLDSYELPAIPGSWVVFEHSGAFISNLQKIEMQYEIKNKENKNPKPLESSRFINPEKAGMKPNFELSDFSPSIPAQGIDIVVPNSINAKPKEPLLIYGSFSIWNNSDMSSGFIPVHLFLTGKQFDGGQIISLQVPRVKTKFENDFVKGYFSLDLMPIFYRSAFGNCTISDNFYITVISGASISEVFLIETNK